MRTNLKRALLITGLSAGLGVASVASAEVGPPLLNNAVYSPIDGVQLDKVQYFWGGRNYCWYPGGWRGPGYYWCGYAWRTGFGWGGPVGWNGWRWRHHGDGPGWRGGGWRGHGGWHGRDGGHGHDGGGHDRGGRHDGGHRR